MRKIIYGMLLLLSVTFIAPVYAGWIGGDPALAWEDPEDRPVTVQNVWTSTSKDLIYFDLTNHADKVFAIAGNQKNLISILLTAVNSGKKISFYCVLSTTEPSIWNRQIHIVSLVSLANQ